MQQAIHRQDSSARFQLSANPYRVPDHGRPNQTWDQFEIRLGSSLLLVRSLASLMFAIHRETDFLDSASIRNIRTHHSMPLQRHKLASRPVKTPGNYPILPQIARL